MAKRVRQKNTMKAQANELYSDKRKWHVHTPMTAAARIQCLARYGYLLNRYGFKDDDMFDRKLKILEPGCGIGSISRLLAFFGDVTSFDYCEVAVKKAERDGGALFFEADGEYPKDIPGIAGKKYDFILLREFHPVTREIAD
ncbi:MAG: class I SAM-dependent methyltransferase, partial [Candidatus Omnitrophota bacterium]